MYPTQKMRQEALPMDLKTAVPLGPSVAYTLDYPLPACLSGDLIDLGILLFVRKPGLTKSSFKPSNMGSLDHLKPSGNRVVSPLAASGQEDDQLPFSIPLHKFSVENESSLREPTNLEVTMKLAQHFSVDGFVTTGEPIMIRLQADKLLTLPPIFVL